MSNPAGNAEDAMRSATEAIAALKRIKPQDDFAARSLSVQALRATELMVEASKAATAEAIATRVASNGHTNGRSGVVATDLSDGVIKALAKGLVPFLKELIVDATAPLLARIVELEATQLTDGGTWKPEKVFRPNQLATYRGALWLCLKASTNVRPGTTDGDWRLMHKTVGGGRED